MRKNFRRETQLYGLHKRKVDEGMSLYGVDQHPQHDRELGNQHGDNRDAVMPVDETPNRAGLFHERQNSFSCLDCLGGSCVTGDCCGSIAVSG